MIRFFAFSLLSVLVIRAAAQDRPGLELHGQATYVRQAKPAFHALYSGAKSFTAERTYGYSFTGTLFIAARLGADWEGYFDAEAVQGRPLSELQGLGGFTNGESQRTAGPDLTAYHARVFVRRAWDLGGALEERESKADQVRTSYAARRFVVTAGNFSVLDVFDPVESSHDPRTQFLNWSSMTYGAWDYPADARGYTWGVAAEYVTERWTVRAGHFLMPLVSNGLTLDRDFTRQYGEALELERPSALAGRKAVFRLLAFRNRVDAGAFRDALAASSTPDVTQVRHLQFKDGVGAATQVDLTDDLGAYVRLGWNDGRTETYAFTEIDRSFAMGLLAEGTRWKRPKDSVGLAAYVNGLSHDHRDYLAAGGQGFFLGDGRLSYGTERILETFYSLHVARGSSISADWQHIENPGYNRDRGPADVYNLRLHFEF